MHAEAGLLELDKHNWPWSMMLVPIMNVDLYELTNNHLWRTEFSRRHFGSGPPDYMHIEQDDDGMTEQGWIDFTLQNYYALLNSGFRLRPTAGTASGVHPVPLGFGRVYVHLPDGFSYDAWMNGLNAGHSFVTTGPLLDVRFNGMPAGTNFDHEGGSPFRLRVSGMVQSLNRLERLEIVSAGQVVRQVKLSNHETTAGSLETRFDESIELSNSSWVALRCFERHSNGRVRYAHTAPVHIAIAGKPLHPRRDETQFLIERVETELARNARVLSEDALSEYKRAAAAYREITTQKVP